MHCATTLTLTAAGHGSCGSESSRAAQGGAPLHTLMPGGRALSRPSVHVHTHSQPPKAPDKQLHCPSDASRLARVLEPLQMPRSRCDDTGREPVVAALSALVPGGAVVQQQQCPGRRVARPPPAGRLTTAIGLGLQPLGLEPTMPGGRALSRLSVHVHNYVGRVLKPTG